MPIPITQGSGASSVASELIGANQYQQIKIVGGETGSTSVLGVTPDGAIRVSILGIPSISGTVNIGTIPGSVIAFQGGTQITSIVGTVALSPSIFGASIIGTVPVIQSGTVIASIAGTVALSPSIFGASIIGTIPATQSGTWTPSAIGYVTRNDALASFLGANLTTRPLASDSAGRVLTRPFSPEESRVEGYASLVSTSVTTLVAAAGTGLRNYITDIMIANSGATTTIITFRDGAGSVLGYTIAPTAGGSNMIGFATPMRTGANATFDFQPTSASSILYATVKGFQAP